LAPVAARHPSVLNFQKIQNGGKPTMAYNKAGEEKKWKLWKEAEEKQLRRLGVSEDVIQRLREADWEDFKSERRYLEHYADASTYIEHQEAAQAQPDIRTVQDLLEYIDGEELYRLLMTVDKLTLQIAVWKMEGYASAEISEKSGLSINAVDRRIYQFKRKIKNIF
jgi:RNA polymerase sigma-70 factor (ECF subfamily)